MKKLMLLSLAMALPLTAMAGKNEEGPLKEIANSPEAAMALALKSKSRSIATCAFGQYLQKASKSVDDGLLDNILKMAKKGEPDHVAFLIASLGSTGNRSAAGGPGAMASALAKKGVEGERIAAAVYCALAMTEHEFAFRLERMTPSPNEDNPVLEVEKPTKPAKGKGKNKKGRPTRKPKPPVLPDELWASQDPEVLQMTILAAAYAKDKTVADKVAAIEAKTKGLPGAKLLYAANTGVEFSEDEANLPFRVRLHPTEMVKTVEPRLGVFNPRPPDAALACEALGISKKAEHLPILHKMLDHQDIRVRFEAARALGRIGSPESMGPLSKSLQRCEWPIAIEICDALGRHPDVRVIPAILTRLQKETGRIRIDLLYALASICGEKKADTIEEWVVWYKKNGRGLEVDQDLTNAFRKNYRLQDMHAKAYTYFYGIHIYSDRFIYVVDTSLSMKGAKIKSMKENLVASLQRIERGPKFNIVDFGGDVIAMRKDLTTPTSSAAKHVEKMPMTLATRTWDALEQASMIEGVDTLVFLSDGAPARSKIRNWTTIRKLWVMETKYRPLSLSTIDFAPTAGNKAAMKALADENYGWNDSVHVN